MGVGNLGQDCIAVPCICASQLSSQKQDKPWTFRLAVFQWRAQPSKRSGILGHQQYPLPDENKLVQLRNTFLTFFQVRTITHGEIFNSLTSVPTLPADPLQESLSCIVPSILQPVMCDH